MFIKKIKEKCWRYTKTRAYCVKLCYYGIFAPGQRKPIYRARRKNTCERLLKVLAARAS